MPASPLPPDLLEHWRLASRVRSVERIAGGELKDVYRIDVEDGSLLCLRRYPPDVTLETVASELRWVDQFAGPVAEVPASIPTAGGDRCVANGGRVAVLTAFIEGDHPDRRVAQHRQAAARMLARLHNAAARIEASAPRSGYPAWRDLDWWRNRWWDWRDVQRFLGETGFVNVRGLNSAALERRLLNGLERLPQLFAMAAGMDLPELPVHNDYFEGNLLQRDGEIAGVVDWDETALDWRAWDIANATWSFSRTDAHAIETKIAAAFLADYANAGGRITGDERLVLLPLIRARQLWETLYELGRACRGFSVDWDYLIGNLTALDGLAEQRL